ncbi:histidine phosphatase family protein [Halomicroarcula sp. S1AR25-4]|uniref:histidine phosphatase family protein n=1 Tax=Haloarcula sp. S1AR25-4 TaxID=2950538 RepID=UPI0028758A21|nr:histidine phosphatase family protein [Halomicroarcula sp. S1AR25-4]MDS0278882.1 histidine phosphatase family protein [Halomicroarcula sp. S1AR25-4]
MATVLVARHGETHWNREGRVQGWAPTRLTDRGREQARALGAWLADERAIDRLVTSDLRRTRETAEQVRETAAGLPDPTVDSAWRERGFGVYQGFLAETLFERHPDHDPEESVSSLDATPEDAESVAAFCDRVESALGDLRTTVGPDETVLLVTHGGVVKVLLAAVTERSLDATITAHSPPNCSVTELRLDGSMAELVAEGARPWRE